MNNINKAILRLSILLASVCLLTNPQAVHAQIPFSFIASSPYDLDAQILFAKYNAAGTPATTTRKAQLNTLIKDLKAAGIWAKLDYFYLWAAHSKSAALIDIKIRAELQPLFLITLEVLLQIVTLQAMGLVLLTQIIIQVMVVHTTLQ